MIVALDADFLQDHPDALRLARAFAKNRRGDDGQMNRLYALESVHSITGAQADHRFALASGAVAIAAMKIAHAVIERAGGALLSQA
ncbi:MAG: hypothetical protein HC882_09685, partial [Acidobacteria bacterium]|nr:hypothetical protein [Acidobacteriota bacterium]